MRNQARVQLPYFDYLLASLAEQNVDVEKSFGRHVHWGYWQYPGQAALTSDDFAAAAENLSQQVCTAAGISDGQRVLDVGCGFGGTIALLNENYNSMQLFGVNLDDRQLQRAHRKVSEIGNNKIRFQQANAAALPFADNCFDAVLAVECIFHFPDRQTFFQEALRVLKPGGYLALSDFVPTGLILPLMKMHLPKPWHLGFYGRCNVECTAKKYRQLAVDNGFDMQLEKDITKNTLPTYAYLRTLAGKSGVRDFTAAFETLVIEVLSRLRMLKYVVYSFTKPA